MKWLNDNKKSNFILFTGPIAFHLNTRVLYYNYRESHTWANMNNPSGPFMDNSSFENFNDNTTRRLKHPVITFFHLIFRSLALIGIQSVVNVLNISSEHWYFQFTFCVVGTQTASSAALSASFCRNSMKLPSRACIIRTAGFGSARSCDISVK